MSLAARYAARSDIGLNRQTNEDAWLVRPPLFAVADGMGGAQAGEVASRVALQTLSAAVAGMDPRDRAVAGEVLSVAAHDANRRIWDLSTEYPSRAGMGTTLTALALCSEGARLAHIGDSRAYVLRAGELAQITDDHSLVAEMVRTGELAAGQESGHPLRSVLSRALGTEPEPQIDLVDVDLLPGDVVLLCSDGLTGPVEPQRIAELLDQDDPEAAAEGLVAAALEAGGPDNVTVVVIRLDEAPPTGRITSTADVAADGTAGLRAAEAAVSPVADPLGPPVAGGAGPGNAATAERPADGTQSVAAGRPGARDVRRRRLLRLAVLVVIIVVVVAAVLALGQLEWVGVDDQGFVSVYRGPPWEFGGLRLYRLHERVLGLRYGDLPPPDRERVDAHAVGWRGSGDRLVDRLREAR